ncbi:hypothetical protein Peur_020823 [Populus x canadensis]
MKTDFEHGQSKCSGLKLIYAKINGSIGYIEEGHWIQRRVDRENFCWRCPAYNNSSWETSVSLLVFQEITTVLAMLMGQTGSLVFPSQVGYELTTCSSEGICQLVSERARRPLLVGVPLEIFRIILILFSSTNR